MARVQHLVLLTMKPGREARSVPLFAVLAALREVLPGIVHFSGGPYSSPEGMNQGYTHGFLMTFADAAARDHYLPHPAHTAIQAEYLPDVERVVAFDYEEA